MTAAEALTGGGVAVVATDTLYGLVARALDEAAVERVYRLKVRSPEKPCIILVSSVDELELFGVVLTPAVREVLDSSWPGPVSIVVDAPEAPSYLTRGTGSLAFRLPADERVLDLVGETGPLIAPSANPEGAPPATTVSEARAYFGDAVDVYDDAGTRTGPPSTLLRVNEEGRVEVLRPGVG